MKPRRRMRLLPILLLGILLALPLRAMADANSRQPLYALVVKDQSNPYMIRMYEGFAEACALLDARCVMAGPDSLDPDGQSQADAVWDLIGQGVAGIAVAANDEATLSAPLGEAKQAGISVVSVDSAVDPQSRQLHVQQADPEMIGRVLLQASRAMTGGQGQVAILSTTQNAPNQATWLEYLMLEYEQNPQAYAQMELVEVAYGLDEPARSAVETRRLLEKYPDLKILIAPTVVGMRAAAEVIEQTGSDVLLTGLGLPSEMEEYILSGVCPWMYLWNPVDAGYLSACTLNALRSGALTGQAGEVFEAGRIGEKLVTQAADGGSEVVLGNPYKFDADNILLWKSAF